MQGERAQVDNGAQGNGGGEGRTPAFAGSRVARHQYAETPKYCLWTFRPQPETNGTPPKKPAKLSSEIILKSSTDMCDHPSQKWKRDRTRHIYFPRLMLRLKRVHVPINTAESNTPKKLCPDSAPLVALNSILGYGLATVRSLLSFLARSFLTDFVANMLLAAIMFNSKIPLTTETVLRIGTIAICIYDYVRTIPAEYKFWRDKGPQIRPNLVLFVLIRYIKSCRRFYMVAVVLKVMQATVCQFVLALRTYSISRRSQRVKIFLIAFTLIITTLEWFTNLYGRLMLQTNGNCTSGNEPTKLVNWTFYIWAMMYDIVTLGLSTYYLIKAGGASVSSMTGLVRAMVMDGLGYIVILTITNTLNLILYRASKLDAQAAAASLGFTFTWIMTQNILIKTRDAGVRSFKSLQPSSGRNPYSSSRSDDQTNMPVTTSRGIELEVQVKIDRDRTVDQQGVKWGVTEIDLKPDLEH
ncbi:uncharacterized protein BT62DRAFT_1081562 [Guyanagaster necrorhizus]|uniref:Uncharacterized protein n=1 Tax=Guyanagaster necrorhizus TaxID=856835 RepID=A0A9P8AM51_9AGAR|nr:uncharacterized protein BT62DRAFT_1081562 [Guyanagaster necrorhizus MCA 3950]KAG7439507.1 hypothetical protein BT62DRAFT_1081562 [Guyanagaster necrorhizus MCA 3950]